MTYQQEYMVNSATETKEFGKVIGRHAVDGLVIAFQGDLGAGKPIWLRELQKEWGLAVQSQVLPSLC